MSEIKTKTTHASVTDFLNQVEPDQKRADAYKILELMENISGEKPKMWGPSIIGFGTYHYTYDSGHEGDMCVTGFSPRKQHLVLYINFDFPESKDLLEKLGRYKISKACLYIKKLSDIDLSILERLIELSIKRVKTIYPQ